MEKEIRLLAFDFDGVIADSMLYVYRCIQAVCRHFGLKGLDFEEFYVTFKQPYMQYYQSLGLPPEVTAEEVREIYFKHHITLPDPEMIEGAARLIKAVAMNGTPMVIVSTHNTEGIETWLGKNGLRAYFASVHGRAVNKAEVLKDLANQHSIPCSEIALIGDLPSDVTDAKSAGAIAIGFAANERMKKVLADAGADHVFTKLTEVMSLL